MVQYKTKRVITVAVYIVLIAIVIAAVVSIARIFFFSDGTNNNQIIISQQALVDTTADRSVSMKVRGPIVADENFRSYQIQVSPNERSMTIYKGYTSQVIKNITLSNNIPAYEQFVYALNRARLMGGNELIGDANDFRGACATGRVYEFNILNANTSEKQLWTSTCSGLRGSLHANLDQVMRLFGAQIPEYYTIIVGLW